MLFQKYSTTVGFPHSKVVFLIRKVVWRSKFSKNIPKLRLKRSTSQINSKNETSHDHEIHYRESLNIFFVKITMISMISMISKNWLSSQRMTAKRGFIYDHLQYNFGALIFIYTRKYYYLSAHVNRYCVEYTGFNIIIYLHMLIDTA